MEKNLKKCKKNLILIGLIIFLNNIKFYNVLAILYFKSITNSYVLGMSIFAIITISSALFELPTGILSDKIGRKRTIVFGSICSVISPLILFISNNYLYLVLYAIISGIEIAFFSGNNDAYVYDNLKMINKEKKYVVFIGKIKSMEYLAAALSGFIGAILLYFSSYKFIIGISIIPKVLQLFLCMFLGTTAIIKVKNNKKREIVTKPLKEVLKNKLLLKKVLYDGIMYSTDESCYQFRSAFYESVWPIWAVGIPGILANVGAFVSNWFSEKIIKITTRKKYWLFSRFYSIFSNILAVITNNVMSPVIMVSNSLFHNDFINSEVEQKLYKDEYRASMGSIKSFIQSLLFSVFSIFLGFIADHFNIIASFIIFQLINIIPIIENGKIIERVAENHK